MSMFHELMMRKKEQIMYATIKGSLTENDGVFSGFSGTNYLALQNQFTLSPTTKAEFDFKINISSLTNNNAIFGSITNYGLYVGVNSSGNLELFVGDNSSWIVTQTGTTTLSVSTDYDIKLNINNNIATLYINGNIELTANLGLVSSNTYDIGVGRGITTSDYFRGSIDLNNSYVKVGVKYNLQAVVGYTIVGSPTIVDGVVSGFSSSDYLKVSPFIISDTDIIEEKISFTTGTISGNQWILGRSQNNILLGIYINSNAKLRIPFVENSGNTVSCNLDYVLSANTSYSVTIVRKADGTLISTLYNNQGIVLDTNSTTAQYAFTGTTDMFIGVTASGGHGLVFNGSIDMNETYIKINNKLWFNGQEG